MKSRNLTVLGILSLCLLCFAAGKEMASQKVCFQLDTADKLYVGIDNTISIVAQQEGPVRLNQVSVSGETYIYDESKSSHFDVEIKEKSGRFIVRADLVGWVKISVNTPSGNVEKKFPIDPIPAVPYFGRSKDGKMASGMFKAQRGMIANIECCGFDAKCTVVGYSILRIGAENLVQRSMNKGSYLTDNSRVIIDAAQTGDIYWFRNILYRCPGSKAPQRAGDFAIEIE